MKRSLSMKTKRIETVFGEDIAYLCDYCGREIFTYIYQHGNNFFCKQCNEILKEEVKENIDKTLQK